MVINVKNIITFIFFLYAFLAVSISIIYAHPGNTASDGCHYCRTNCDKWGVPWNERHCHGGVAPNPTENIVIEPTRTIFPTLTPTPIPVPTETPTKAPTAVPEVKGEAITPTEILVQTESDTKGGDPTLGFITLGALGVGGFWLIRKLQTKSKKDNLSPPRAKDNSELTRD